MLLRKTTPPSCFATKRGSLTLLALAFLFKKESDATQRSSGPCLCSSPPLSPTSLEKEEERSDCKGGTPSFRSSPLLSLASVPSLRSEARSRRETKGNQGGH